MIRSTSQIVIFLVWILCESMIDLSFSRSASQVRCNERDRELLLQFKISGVDPSNRLSSWSSEEDCCKWNGVQCHNITGRVTKLSLMTDDWDFQKPLRGEINLRLLQLEYLEYLDLQHNNFSVVHCSTDDRQRYQNLSQITNFSTLFYLDLSDNPYMNVDNLKWLSCIPSLKYLDLSFNDLHRETDWLGSITTMLPSLSELRLQECQLSLVSSSPRYGNFSSLTLLDLSGNSFDRKIPNWISNLSNSLSYLDLGENKLDGQIPDMLLNVRNLNTLILRGNNLSGSIPEWLGQYNHLQTLDLSYNSFQGSIPSTLGNLSSLTELDVSYNHLNSTLPERLGQLSRLATLKVGGNSLEGVLSESNFAKLSNLKHLDLSSTALLFHFATNWIPPFQLEEIILNSCTLGQEFPAWIYTQKSLQQLEISSSGISSVDEDKFWSFVSNITYALDISNNAISGNISNLVLRTWWIDLSSNKITGGLPRLTRVNSFLARNNFFSGPISPFLCGNAEENELRFLDLSYNLLSGKIPECWTKWKNLESIDLGSNNFTGKIPPSFCAIPDLQLLHLYKNNLSGDVPLSLQHCKKLLLLNLAENQLSGSIPSWMGESIGIMRLRSNQFSGNIPPQICQLSSLIILDLADNRLSGAIPKCLYNITSMANPNLTFLPSYFGLFDDDLSSVGLVTKGQELEYGDNFLYLMSIDISSNNLSGGIPQELFGLSALQSLNLSQNHLFGNIPQEIGKMKYLESLDLSENQLCGEIPQTMSGLSFLSYLNLSFNNFTGNIPTGTQLQSFDALSYIGNPELCGAPLNNCKHEIESVDRELNAEGEDEFTSWFYFGIGTGFASGLLGFCAALSLNQAFNHAYFSLLDHIKDKVLLMMNSFFH
ncbi:hypothetical protein L6164_016793 [Bauhinia variegata]|uniref:Uncharacterized protein n=1 Tax=Bauhinia variegata TaxID=167791 RepID=A0ACB9N5V6_BAUVA|nr:hypothetical protein L6164_016793 [Bauhinia variegata]